MPDQAPKRYHRCGNCTGDYCRVTGFCEWLGFAHCHVSCLIWCGLGRTWRAGRNRLGALAAGRKAS